MAGKMLDILYIIPVQSSLTLPDYNKHQVTHKQLVMSCKRYTQRHDYYRTLSVIGVGVRLAVGLKGAKIEKSLFGGAT